jgi:hypothetical protein
MLMRFLLLRTMQFFLYARPKKNFKILAIQTRMGQFSPKKPSHAEKNFFLIIVTVVFFGFSSSTDIRYVGARTLMLY